MLMPPRLLKVFQFHLRQSTFYKAYPYLYLMQQTQKKDFDFFLKLTLSIDSLFIFFPTPPYYLHSLILGI